MKTFVRIPLSGFLLCCAVSPVRAEAYPAYEMTIELAPGQSSMEVVGELTIPAASAAQDEIILGLSEALFDLEAEIVAPASAAGTRAAKSDFVKGISDGWGTNRYVLRPAEPIPAGSPVRIAFHCRGEEASAFVYHLGEPVTFAGGINTSWYPQVQDARSSGSGWSGLRAIGTLEFQLPDGLSVYAAGRVEGVLQDATQFTFELPVFFSFSAAEYRVLESASGSKTSAYFLSHRAEEKAYIDGSTAVVDLLEATFGPYPYSRFAIVEVPADDADAAGFSGASLDGFIMATGSFLDRRFNTAYYGHEIGHQWWGNLMTTNSERGSMMFSEGMAQYGSLVAVEALDGPEAAERYRRIGYPGYMSLQSGLGYLRIAAAGLDERIPEANDGSAARIIADGKGFQVWNMLADEVGPDRFHDALGSLIVQHQLKPVAWDDFLTDLEQNLDEDLGWFYEQWFDRTGAPEPSLKWHQVGDDLTLTISQPEPIYRMHVDVDVLNREGYVKTHRVLVSEAKTSVQITAPNTVSATLDPRFRILRWTDEYRAIAESLAPITGAQLTNWSGDQDKAVTMLRETLAQLNKQTDPSIHGRRYAAESVLGQLLTKQEEFEEAKIHLEAALRSPSRLVDDLPWVYYGLAKVAMALGDPSLLAEVQRSIGPADALAGGTGAPEALQRAVAAN